MTPQIHTRPRLHIFIPSAGPESRLANGQENLKVYTKLPFGLTLLFTIVCTLPH